MVLFSKRVGFADPGLSSDLLLSLARGHAVFGVRRANRYAFECAVEGFFLYLSKFFVSCIHIVAGLYASDYRMACSLCRNMDFIRLTSFYACTISDREHFLPGLLIRRIPTRRMDDTCQITVCLKLLCRLLV
jgi:hypothetical protein